MATATSGTYSPLQLDHTGTHGASGNQRELNQREVSKQTLRVETSDQMMRFLHLKGHLGNFVVQLADGWKTTPSYGKSGLLINSTRAHYRMTNIAVYRGKASDLTLSQVMVGPNHYFGSLIDIHLKAYSIEINNGFPIFSESRYESQDDLKNLSDLRPLQACDILEFNQTEWSWNSGKCTAPAIVQFLSDKILDRQSAASLTADLGVLTLPNSVIEIPHVDATQVDISAFGAILVINNTPFTIAREREDTMDAVSYCFGEGYADYQIKHGNGLFLETHDFTQIMTPLTPSSSGFITLGRRVGIASNQTLQLIGVSVPFGYSIIVKRGAMHGDATFTGHYAMAMTVQHTTMGTADVVFLRTPDDQRVKLTCDFPNKDRIPSYGADDERLMPLTLPQGRGIEQEIRENSLTKMKQTPKPRGVYTKSVLNPTILSFWQQLFS
ncbi:hypothetical protein [Parashewanella tropica]|uniref:hypothetical protein n=1 Tax=Parashewanella tropica TaxID=2547970 RepID=UPI001059539D|nr:hypothetical protein [Parashewanella tropica]